MSQIKDILMYCDSCCAGERRQPRVIRADTDLAYGARLGRDSSQVDWQSKRTLVFTVFTNLLIILFNRKAKSLTDTEREFPRLLVDSPKALNSQEPRSQSRSPTWAAGT